MAITPTPRPCGMDIMPLTITQIVYKIIMFTEFVVFIGLLIYLIINIILNIKNQQKINNKRNTVLVICLILIFILYIIMGFVIPAYGPVTSCG